MRLWVVSLFTLLLLILPASAEEITIEGVSSQTVNAAEGNVFTFIQLHNIDRSATTTISLDTDTYTFNANITYLNWYSTQVDTSFYCKVEGNTSYLTDTWYFLPLEDLAFQFGSKDDLLVGLVGGGNAIVPLVMYDGKDVYPPSSFTLTSDAALDITYHEVESSGASYSLTDELKKMVEKVPYVGPLVVQTLSITASLVVSFYTYAVFAIENWAILIMTFETFVLLRAVIIMQGRGKQSKKISKAITSIVSDNKKMIEFTIIVFTKIITLVYDAIKTIGAWVPFT